MVRKFVEVYRVRMIAWGAWWDYSKGVDESYLGSLDHLATAFGDVAKEIRRKSSWLKPWMYPWYLVGLFCSWRSAVTMKKRGKYVASYGVLWR